MTKQTPSPVSPQVISKEAPKGKRKVLPDLLLVGTVVLLALLALFLYQCTGKTGEAVAIIIDGKETATYSLSQDREVVIETPDGGINILRIEGGEAYILDANCPDGICAGHAPIHKTNETIVCLPHKLVVKVVSKDAGNAPDIVV